MNYQYFHEDHFKWGFDARSYGARRTSSEEFWWSFSKAPVIVPSFRDACLEACRIIVRNSLSLGRPITLCLSGGIDSEVVARCLREIGADFQAIIYEYPNQLNQHDVRMALDLCKTLGIPFRLEQYDILRALTVDAKDWLDRYNVVRPYLYVYYDMIRRAPGYPVFCAGNIQLEPFVQRNFDFDNPPQLVWREYDQDQAPTAALWEDGVPAVTRFYRFTANLLSSFLEDPLVKMWTQYHESLGSAHKMHDFKIFIYARHWPELKSRPKFTSYEHINPLHKFLRIQRSLQFREQQVHVTLEELRSSLGLI